MICPSCKNDYAALEPQWCYEQEGNYRLLCDVFTCETLEQVLQHALENRLTEIYIDTYQPEHPQCDDCYFIHIREGYKRSELLEQPQFQHIKYHEFF